MVLPISNAGLQKAAILMVLLGEDTASHIYRNLPENDVQRLTRRIAELEHFKPETAISVLEEYYQLTLTQNYVAEGGPEYAQKLLVKAFGDVGAKRLLEQVSNAMEQNAVHLESLQEADPQQLAKFLEVEHPQTIALILAHLNARQASTLLLRLPEEIRAETVKRLAQLRQFSPEVAQKVALALNKRLESLGEQSRRTYAGFKGAADMLNQLEPLSSKGILENIEKDNPKMALAIRNLMFTFEDLLGVPEAGIRELLGQLDKKTLALGFGFRCGFLGLLHMEIIQERLEREYELDLITTAPGVRYHITLTDGSLIEVDNPSRWPEPTNIEKIQEPVIAAKILTNEEYVGGILKLVEEKRGRQLNFEYVTPTRVMLTYELPLNEIVLDFYDRLKSISRGYASLDYQLAGEWESPMVKLDILVSGEPVD